jgi:hypothetical protein
MADEVLRSIKQRRFRESPMEDFAVISELAEVCDDHCKHPLLPACREKSSVTLWGISLHGTADIEEQEQLQAPK